MTTKLTPELEQEVAAQQGCAMLDGDEQSYVLMRLDVYRELLGVGSDEEYEASLQAIRRGWEDVQAGRTIPMKDFLRELRQKYGLPS